jgi:hypothetical protein
MNRALSAAARQSHKEKPPRRNPGGKYESRGWRRNRDRVAIAGQLTSLASDGRPRCKTRAQTRRKHRRFADPTQRGGGGSRCRDWNQTPNN